jgi:hypothetical protein
MISIPHSLPTFSNFENGGREGDNHFWNHSRKTYILDLREVVIDTGFLTLSTHTVPAVLAYLDQGQVGGVSRSADGDRLCVHDRAN